MTRPYRDGLLKRLAVRDEAMAYISAAFDDSEEAFVRAVANVAKAQTRAPADTNTGAKR